MIQVKIKGKEYLIPTEWKEVTLKQYVQLVHYADRLEAARLISIFVDLPYEELVNLPCDEFTLKVVPEMDFFGKPFDPLAIKRSKTINIGNYEIETILDPSKERFGQKIYMQQLINSAIQRKVNHATLVAPVVACYYAPYIHPEKKWDERHVKEVETLVNAMTVVEAYPEADFFLRGYIKYAPTKKKH